MQKLIIIVLATTAILSFSIYGQGGASDDSDKKTTKKAAKASFKMINFVTTQDGSPLVIKPELFTTPEARKFAETGKNPYIGNQLAIQQGMNLYELYSCMACHGGNAQGEVGPSLQGPNYHYPKDATNKGMFETIWHGTNGGMGAKGIGLMSSVDPTAGLTPDQVLKVEAWIRSRNSPAGSK